ncbi:MAG TPA: hypothetical protein VKZ50_01210 [bacterium]|nr:hypothetical protein [bacterium]
MAIPAAKEPQTAASRSVRAQHEQVADFAQVVIELKNMNRHLERIGNTLVAIREAMTEREHPLDL